MLGKLNVSKYFLYLLQDGAHFGKNILTLNFLLDCKM